MTSVLSPASPEFFDRFGFALTHEVSAEDQAALIAAARSKSTRRPKTAPTARVWLGLRQPDPESLPKEWLAGRPNAERILNRWGYYARFDASVSWRWREHPATPIVQRLLEPVMPLFRQLTKVGVRLQRPGHASPEERHLVVGCSYGLASPYNSREGTRLIRYEGAAWLTALRPIESTALEDGRAFALKIPLTMRPPDNGRPYLRDRDQIFYSADARYLLMNEIVPHGAEPVDFWRGVVVVHGILDWEAVKREAKVPLTLVQIRRGESPGASPLATSRPERPAATSALMRTLDEIEGAIGRAKRAPLESIAEAVRRIDLRRDSLSEAAGVMLRFLFKEPPERRVVFRRVKLGRHHPYQQAIERSSTLVEAGVRRLWLSGPHHLSHASLYALYLYNRGYGAARASLDHLFTAPEPHPYPRVLLSYLLRDLLGASRDELIALERQINAPEVWAPWLNELFAEDRIGRWLAELPFPPKTYSVYTNTVVGKYDWVRRHPDSGLRQPITADVYYDLGGGQATAYISELLERPFASLDLSPPMNDSVGALIIRKRVRRQEPRGDGIEPMSAVEQQRYLARVAATPFRRFDVFESAFDTAHDSYFITSFGFLSSTPIGFQSAIPSDLRGSAREALGTSYAALLRVLELVKLGKKVDLFTLERATARAPAVSSALFSFRDQRVVDLSFVRSAAFAELPLHSKVDAELVEQIDTMLDPERSPYAALVGLRR